MIKTLILTLAALLVVLMSNLYVGRAQQTDFNPEVLWESQSPVTFNTLKFSPDDKYFFIRNDGGIYKFNAENGEYMGLFISGLFIDFVMIEEYGWMICALEKDISIFDLNAGSFIRKIGDAWPGNWIDVSPDKTKIAFRQLENILVYSLPNFEEICRINHPDTGAPRFVGNNTILVTHGYYMYDEGNYPFYAIDLYSANDGKFIKTLASPHPAGVGNTIYISPDNKYIISTGSSRVNFYDIETGELVKNIPSSQPYYYDFNQTSDYYTISDFNNCSIFNYHNHKEIIRVNNDLISLLVFLNKDNKRIFSNKMGKFKMLSFDFDSLLTDVVSNEDYQVIYPNPTDNFIVIPFNNNFNLNYINLTITDNLGKTYKLPYENEINSLRLNISSLPKGIYYLTLQKDKLLKTYKFIKGE